MDKLLTETKVEKEISSATDNVVEEKNQADIKVKQAPPQNSSYISSFENLTIADVKKEEETKQEAQEELQTQAETEQNAQEGVLQNTQEEVVRDTTKSDIAATATATDAMTIEKPNYDLLESKVIKLKKTAQPKKKRSKRLAGLALACALGGAAIICVTNCVILDQMNSNFVKLEDSYNLKLGKYLRDIYNLDATHKGMEMIETYPEDLLDAGDLGQKSNWFDRLCNFIGGLFGG